MKRGWPAAFALLTFTALIALMSVAPAKAQEKDGPFQTIDVTIPNGAANPSPDLTFQNLANWYDPSTVVVSAGDTVVWKNEDTEHHTVTSGRGAGIASAQTNERGTPDGLFDSEFFSSGESWSYTFYVPGTYTYFCTIHPWMEGIVDVGPIEALPNYPVDYTGSRHENWPVHTFSNNGEYDIDLKWDPVAIETGKATTLFIDFFDARTNERLQLTPYEFVIIQDGKELERTYGLTDIGTGVYKYEFAKPGPITMRVERVGDKPDAWSEFTTIVYPSSESTSFSQDAGITKVSGGTQPASRLINPLTLVTFTYAVIFGIPAAVGIVIFLFKKGKI